MIETRDLNTSIKNERTENIFQLIWGKWSHFIKGSELVDQYKHGGINLHDVTP